MFGDPQDKTGYGVAIASIGIALAVLLAGICWIATQPGDPTEVTAHYCAAGGPSNCKSTVAVHSAVDAPVVPHGLWIALAAAAGVLVGTLIPLPILGRSAGLRITIALAGVLLAGALATAPLHLGHSSVRWAACGLILGLLIPAPGSAD